MLGQPLWDIEDLDLFMIQSSGTTVFSALEASMGWRLYHVPQINDNRIEIHNIRIDSRPDKLNQLA